MNSLLAVNCHSINCFQDIDGILHIIVIYARRMYKNKMMANNLLTTY